MGCRGEVTVPYETLPKSAKPNVDYIDTKGELHFMDNEDTYTELTEL